MNSGPHKVMILKEISHCE